MNLKADLHLHTKASDGELAPGELVELCARHRLETIAITDHDTLAGVRAAQAAGQNLGLNVIAGIELSVTFEPGSLHLLGYFPAYPAGLEAALGHIQAARQARLPLILARLNELGYAIGLDEVLHQAGESQVGRPHIARVLVESGQVASFEAAFDQLLKKGRPAYVEKAKLAWPEALELIRSHGGLAVLAHPFTLELADHELNALLGQMRAQGLNGIETFYPQHTKAQKRLYKRLARQHDLLLTGGSDYHGQSQFGLHPGSDGIDAERLRPLLERLGAGKDSCASLAVCPA
jgi:hypothetical protein